MDIKYARELVDEAYDVMDVQRQIVDNPKFVILQKALVIKLCNQLRVAADEIERNNHRHTHSRYSKCRTCKIRRQKR